MDTPETGPKGKGKVIENCQEVGWVPMKDLELCAWIDFVTAVTQCLLSASHSPLF